LRFRVRAVRREARLADHGPAGLPALLDAIRHMHGCEATFVESVPVRETFRGATAWEGEVQVFDVIGHPTAKRCYA
jgi:hypothetical protein